MRLMLADELFTFVTTPGVDGNNNVSEGRLRDDAMARKTGRTSNTPSGAKRQSIISSVLQSIGKQLEAFTLAGVIAEATRWLQSGRSCFQEMLDQQTIEEEVSVMDRLRRRNDLRSERMSRRISEGTATGMSTDEALCLAMNEEGFGCEPTDNPKHDEEDDAGVFNEADEPDEPWNESLPQNPFDESARQDKRDRHPAVMQTQGLLLRLMDIDLSKADATSFLSIACQGAGNMVGGLVQATCDEFDSRIGRALAITQLNRALSGHAFARGAVFGLHNADAIDKETSNELHAQLESLLESIHDLMSEAWTE